MKAKITVIITREIDLDGDYFDEGTTYNQRLQGEIKYAEDLFHEWIEGDNMQWETKGELLPQDFDPIESTRAANNLEEGTE